MFHKPERIGEPGEGEIVKTSGFVKTMKEVFVFSGDANPDENEYRADSTGKRNADRRRLR